MTESDITNLEMTLGQRKLLVKAITELRKGSNVTTLDPDPVTTKSLAKDGGLDEILKKIEGIGGIDDPLLTLGATETPLPRLDNDPQVFLGTNAKPAQGAKGGEKPLLIPDFVSVNNLANNEEEQEIGSSGGASIVIRAQKGKPKLENITLSMWIAANVRIMHELLTTGKLSGTPSIADYLSYTVKFAELLESHTFLSALLYDNEYRKLQHKYGFRWGSHSQHLHTGFLVKRRPTSSAQAPPQKSLARNRQQHVPSPICRQFNSPTGCQWPNCRFQHVCIISNCNQPHPQHEHPIPHTGS